MYKELEEDMSRAGFKDLDVVRSHWTNDFKSRSIVSGFLKDKALGAKRLTSMPDRITNTISVVGTSDPVLRPTVINMYDSDLSSVEVWWPKWRTYIFDTDMTIQDKKEGSKTLKVHEMLQPISKAKYPAITEEEVRRRVYGISTPVSGTSPLFLTSTKRPPLLATRYARRRSLSPSPSRSWPTPSSTPPWSTLSTSSPPPRRGSP